MHRCNYCDFNTYAGLDALIPRYTAAVIAEIGHVTRTSPERIALDTIFFGGGTPSLLSIPQLESILTGIRDHFALSDTAEITLEANPGTLSPGYLGDLVTIGINRLSLGVQSADPVELRLLERQHDFETVIQTVAAARQAGITNLNLDLIYGIPGQNIATWQISLKKALELSPEHISLYALTLEHGTPLAAWVGRGLLPHPDADLAADMYEWAAERLATAGYEQYEISNWARLRDGNLLSCRHNFQYWRNLPYLGVGAGAHGFIAQVRTVNVLAPAAYIQRCLADGSNEPDGRNKFPRTPATQSITAVEREAEIGETMMMGLRLVQEGVSDLRFKQRFGQSLEDVFAEPIARLIRQGLLEWSPGEERSLRLTQRGYLLGNRVFLEFI